MEGISRARLGWDGVGWGLWGRRGGVRGSVGHLSASTQHRHTDMHTHGNSLVVQGVLVWHASPPLTPCLGSLVCSTVQRATSGWLQGREGPCFQARRPILGLEVWAVLRGVGRGTLATVHDWVSSHHHSSLTAFINKPWLTSSSQWWCHCCIQGTSYLC